MILLNECRIVHLHHLLFSFSIFINVYFIKMSFFSGFGNEFCCLIAILVQVVDGANVLSLRFCVGDGCKAVFFFVLLVAVAILKCFHFYIHVFCVLHSRYHPLARRLLLLQRQITCIFLIITPKRFSISQNSRIHLL